SRPHPPIALPPFPTRRSSDLIVPQISLSPRLGGTGQFAIPLGPIRSHQFSADIQKIRGSHTLSAGAMLFHIHSFDDGWGTSIGRSEEHTSELQSRSDLVCRLL